MQQRPKKPIKAYEELFEDLMEYTDYKSSDDIKTREDLFDFFSQVKEDSESKGRNFIVSRPLFSRIGQALDNIRDKKPVEGRKQKIIRSRRVFRSFNDAKKAGFLVHEEGKQIYKAPIKLKGVVIVRWKNDKGRFVKTPKD